MKKILVSILLIIGFLFACKDEPLEPIKQDLTPYNLQYGSFPQPLIPLDNQLTQSTVQLGRMLFYDPILSKDGTQACASCHLQDNGFSDPNQFSQGVEGLVGKRHSMAILNLAWHTKGFFWDGRALTLREQALQPIEDPLEMNETLENVVQKLSTKSIYQDQFSRAFGTAEINSERLGLALEQFMLSMVSNNSKYDRVKAGLAQFTPEEANGQDLFFKEYDPANGIEGGECFHCHGGFNFTNNQYMNNGLDAQPFTDMGRFLVTNEPKDRAAFKVPTLRNIALTAPYMHDGRMTTLEQVMEHYDSGVKDSPTLSDLLFHNVNTGLNLSNKSKADIIAFLHTLSDEEFINNTNFKSPF